MDTGMDTGMDAGVDTDSAMKIDDTATEISPSVWLGSYGTLSQQQFVDANNIKVIINCRETCGFLEALNASGMNVSSDMIVLLLDPSFDAATVAGDEREMLAEYESRFGRVLLNYINFFYDSNPHANNLVHQLPQNGSLCLSSPILRGNLKQQLFNINRLLRLMRNVNDTIGTLIVSHDGNSLLSTAVAMSYLMDNYNFNFDASYTNLRIARPLVLPLNFQYYDDLLIVENLKRFYQENSLIKQHSAALLTANCNLKRKNEFDFIWVGGDAKRKNIN